MLPASGASVARKTRKTTGKTPWLNCLGRRVCMQRHMEHDSCVAIPDNQKNDTTKHNCAHVYCTNIITENNTTVIHNSMNTHLFYPSSCGNFSPTDISLFNKLLVRIHNNIRQPESLLMAGALNRARRHTPIIYYRVLPCLSPWGPPDPEFGPEEPLGSELDVRSGSSRDGIPPSRKTAGKLVAGCCPG
jgi:hypothetical protein